ncbi:MAG: RluA family pseudouridine synthase [Candidatus Omnitrophota bacterium]|nr:RluA family pseudouridine synthase [Candidatus Omnitrophota bacterium]
MEKRIIAPEEAKGERLDRFLQKSLSAISRTKVHALIEAGNILIAGSAKKPSYRLKANDDIYIKFEEEKKDLLKPFEFIVNIIYEDNDIIIIDKPTNLVVHPPAANIHNTLVNAMLYMKKNLSSINPYRCGIVHRLDKETSGVMVLAKNNQSHLNLIEQFSARKVKKEYFAIVWGKVEKEEITVDLPMRRDDKNRLKMKVSFIKSKKARTDVGVKERLRGSTLLLLKPFTGRMHQIRVHLNFLGFPIIGDKKYGIKDEYPELFLHAHKLGFYHPNKGNFIEFISPMPERFEKFIAEHR